MYLLIVVGYKSVDFLKNGYEFFYKILTTCINIVAVFHHHLLPYFVQRFVGQGFLFQQGIALFQRIVVVQQRVQIGFIVLRYHAVHKFTSFVAAVSYQFIVTRRNQHQGQQPDMIGQPVVFLFISFEMFFLPPFHAAVYFLFRIAKCIFPLQHKEISIVFNIL